MAEQIAKMGKELRNLRKKLKTQKSSFQKREEKLKKTFENSLGINKFKRLMSKRKPHYQDEEISSAYSLYIISKRAYQYTRNFIDSTLPSISTLLRHTSKIKIKVGFIDISFELMKTLSSKAKTNSEKLVVLSFDEVYIKNTYSYQQSMEICYPPSKNAQVLMIRTLCGKKKIPIYVNFDQRMTQEILMTAIKKSTMLVSFQLQWFVTSQEATGD